jgi:hypothetical protein
LAADGYMPSCRLSFSSSFQAASFQADILRGRLPCGVSLHLASKEISGAPSCAFSDNSISILHEEQWQFLIPVFPACIPASVRRSVDDKDE